MDFDIKESILTVVSTVTFFAGIVLALTSSRTLTIIGIVLIVVSAIVLIIDMGDIIGRWHDATRE